MPEPCKTVASQPQWELYELESKLLKGGYIGDYIGDYYGGHEGGCREFRLAYVGIMEKEMETIIMDYIGFGV